MESLSAIKWNGCPASNGITVRDQMEWVSGMDWNTHNYLNVLNTCKNHAEYTEFSIRNNGSKLVVEGEIFVIILRCSFRQILPDSRKSERLEEKRRSEICQANCRLLANIFSFDFQILIQHVHCTSCTFRNHSQPSIDSSNRKLLMPCT